jgi:hypothetical protein
LKDGADHHYPGDKGASAHEFRYRLGKVVSVRYRHYGPLRLFVTPQAWYVERGIGPETRYLPEERKKYFPLDMAEYTLALLNAQALPMCCVTSSA